MSYEETRPADEVRKLVDTNEQLRKHVTELQSERRRLEEERIDLRERVLCLEHELDQLRGQENTLKRRIREAEEASQEFSARYVEVEEQNNKLANLYVASYRLHETTSRDDALTALQEIVINLIGSEDFLILEQSPASDRLAVAASFGVEPDRVAELELADGPIGRTARTGELYFSDHEPRGESDIVACIPLKLGEETCGVIAILRLLDHKRNLEALDHELFDLLASHAATALQASRGAQREAAPGN